MEIDISNLLYVDLTIKSKHFVGSGKCWVQRYTSGKRGDFITPFDFEKDPENQVMSETYHLDIGFYLINEMGTKVYGSKKQGTDAIYDKRTRIEVYRDKEGYYQWIEVPKWKRVNQPVLLPKWNRLKDLLTQQKRKTFSIARVLVIMEKLESEERKNLTE